MAKSAIQPILSRFMIALRIAIDSRDFGAKLPANFRADRCFRRTYELVYLMHTEVGQPKGSSVISGVIELKSLKCINFTRERFAAIRAVGSAPPAG